MAGRSGDAEEAASRLVVFACCLALAVTAGWALGRMAGFVSPELAGPVTGFEHVNDAPDHADAPLIVPQEIP